MAYLGKVVFLSDLFRKKQQEVLSSTFEWLVLVRNVHIFTAFVKVGGSFASNIMSASSSRPCSSRKALCFKTRSPGCHLGRKSDKLKTEEPTRNTLGFTLQWEIPNQQEVPK